MKIYRVETVRLSTVSGDSQLADHINGQALLGWELHSVGSGVPTRTVGGVTAIDRLLVFERDSSTLLVEVKEEEEEITEQEIEEEAEAVLSE